jgi:hypothetical protein
VLALFVVGGVIGAYCAVRIGFAAATIPLAVVLMISALTATTDSDF